MGLNVPAAKQDIKKTLKNQIKKIIVQNSTQNKFKHANRAECYKSEEVF